MSQLKRETEESSSSSTRRDAAKKEMSTAQEATDSGVGGTDSLGVQAVAKDVAVENPERKSNPHVKAGSEHGRNGHDQGETKCGQLTGGPITIGGALEAAAITAGNKPVDRSDAAAIQAAEVRATGRTSFVPGGLAATAQSAAQNNAKLINDEEKTTLSHVLTDATSKLPKDKPVTRQDAEGVVSAELRNNPDISTYPTGVAASVVAAARINQNAAAAAAAAASAGKSKN